MEIRQLALEGVAGFSLSGKLDVRSSAETVDYIIPHLQSKTSTIIDMTCCEYVSSSGLRALLIIAKQTAMQGGTMGLVNVSDDVWEVMEMTGFDSVFVRFDGIDEAIVNIKAG